MYVIAAAAASVGSPALHAPHPQFAMYSGASYMGDYRRDDDNTFRKIQEGYWTAKQAVKAKLGKKEDDHLVASDQELDAKLAVFYSVKESCEAMLRCIERYQDFICDLSQEENALGRFLKSRGKADKTAAGKMMGAVGRAQSFTAQQRLALRVPLVRLYQELDVFTERAVEDTLLTVEKMERARTEYRGSLLWMKNVSEALDPDAYNRLDKFRHVQGAVKRNKALFDQSKLNCLQKIDLLAASRCNLFSHLMSNYQKCLLHFWERTAKAHGTVSENFKGYQHYEFTILKDLSETSRKLAALTAGEKEEEQTDEAKKKREEDIANELISLEASSEAALTAGGVPRRGSMEQLLFGLEEASPEAAKSELDFLSQPAAGAAPAPKEGGGGGELMSLETGTDADALFADMLGRLDGAAPAAQTSDSFDTLWTANFEETPPPLPPPPTHGAGPQNDIGQKVGPSGAGVASQAKGGEDGSPLRTPKGLLPSQLLDLSALSAARPPPPAAAQSGAGEKKAAWFSLFAELDPLGNPDAIGNPSQGSI